MNLKKTKHAIVRANQRGIKDIFIELVYLLGTDIDDKRLITRKQCLELSSVLSALKRKVDKMAEKGGYVGVINKDTLITIYRANSNSSKKRKNFKNLPQMGELL